tara:strand:- start:1441 stop:2184 length:744 start_codon:yes stop_codon:yes gene_type:complete
MLVRKYVGETTKEFADRIRCEKGIADDVKVAICGKLDPQACGVTKVLFGEDTKMMPKYLQSNKTYEFFIALGISTDSDDIMGRITNIDTSVKNNIESIKSFMNTYIINQTTQKYHPISAKKINKGPGKKRPLWYWHKKGILEESDLPSKPVKVISLRQTTDIIELNYTGYLDMVKYRLNSITDKERFNIKEITSGWDGVSMEKVILIPYEIKVSSGFYVRMISKEIRDNLNLPVHIFGINRLKVERI